MVCETVKLLSFFTRLLYWPYNMSQLSFRDIQSSPLLLLSQHADLQLPKQLFQDCSLIPVQLLLLTKVVPFCAPAVPDQISEAKSNISTVGLTNVGLILSGPDIKHRKYK